MKQTPWNSNSSSISQNILYIFRTSAFTTMLQKPTTGPHREPDESNPKHSNIIIISFLQIFIPIHHFENILPHNSKSISL